MTIKVFKVIFRVKYVGEGAEYHDQEYNVIATDGEQAIKRARKLVSKFSEWDDENEKHHKDRLLKAWPSNVSFVIETDD